MRYQDVPAEHGRSGGPTAKQLWVLRHIASCVSGLGYPPSTRDLEREMGVGPQTVNGTLRALETKGLLLREEGKARAMRITAAGRAALRRSL